MFSSKEMQPSLLNLNVTYSIAELIMSWHEKLSKLEHS